MFTNKRKRYSTKERKVHPEGNKNKKRDCKLLNVKRQETTFRNQLLFSLSFHFQQLSNGFQDFSGPDAPNKERREKRPGEGNHVPERKDRKMRPSQRRGFPFLCHLLVCWSLFCFTFASALQTYHQDCLQEFWFFFSFFFSFILVTCYLL